MSYVLSTDSQGREVLLHGNDLDWLMHVGIPHDGMVPHSGRYPWGSGNTPYERATNFNEWLKGERAKGKSWTQIAKETEISSTKLRQRMSANRSLIWMANAHEAMKLHDKGWSNVAIGKKMGVPDTTVGNWLNPIIQERNEKTTAIVDALKKSVDENKYVDVGKGTAHLMDVSSTRLGTALDLLERQEGYRIHKFQQEQATTGKQTNMMVLTKNDVSYGELMKHLADVVPVGVRADETEKKFEPPKPPVEIDEKRIFIRYTDENGKGGAERDGEIQLRRGVPDLSLGDNLYAQVRIGVSGHRYMKGMALYSDEVPKGYDVIYNTKYSKDEYDKVFKNMKSDPEFPFGATIRDDKHLQLTQTTYVDPKDGKTKQSAVNIVNEEDSYGQWQKKLSAQFLSKQLPAVAKRQLDLTYKIKRAEFEDIMKLTNPVVKKKLLEEFADSCDSDAVDLKAVGMPRQTARVILSLPNIRETDCYAPGYNNGDVLVLIRYPHAGRFELAQLRVNNTDPEGRSTIGDRITAIGIHPKVAKTLSGADFDGDTVTCVVNNDGAIRINNSGEFAALKNFDPSEAYPGYPGMKVMTKREKGIQMGMASNLITDMTIQNAPPSEIIKAVKHSMVVIDAEKHKLNWKLSEAENGIKALREKYQRDEEGHHGPRTLISRAAAETEIPFRKRGIVYFDEEGRKRRQMYDKETGEILWETPEKTTWKPKTSIRVKRDEEGNAIKENGQSVKEKVYLYDESGRKIGKEVPKTMKVARMETVKDAFDLAKGTQIEKVYGNYANSMKAMANEARKAFMAIEEPKVNKSARAAYENEIKSLMIKVIKAEKNSPLERWAQRKTGTEFAKWREENPNLSADDYKKQRSRILKRIRDQLGAKKIMVDIEPKEWEAIQSGGVSANFLNRVLSNANPQQYKALAMPRESGELSGQQVATIRSLKSRGYDISEISNALGISMAKVQKAMTGR